MWNEYRHFRGPASNGEEGSGKSCKKKSPPDLPGSLTDLHTAMIGVYQSVMVALLAPFEIADGNRLLAYGLVVFGAQLMFWVATGLWGLSRTHLNVRELIKLPGFKGDPGEESTA
ncbi:MAG: hypothetical protein P8Y03_12115 [Anaerolineales bacterium]